MTPLRYLAPLAAILLGSAVPPPAPPRLDYDFGCGAFTGGSCAELADSSPAPAPAPPAAVPSPAPDPDGVRIVVSIPQQKAWVYRGAVLVASSPVSTGKPGHETPTGTFRVLEKKVDHRSNRYSNAPMPYMQRLTTYGIALHAGHLPGFPASHGCIRLPRSFAKKLYGMTNFSTRVTVTRERVRIAARRQSPAGA
jgi:lipoprotein-anchoring transpeptidase ErfK/SrfK